MAPVGIHQIVDMLASRAPDLAQRLIPKGHREGDDWVDAKRANGGLGDSLKVNIRHKPGIWAHFAADRRGDALDLVAYLATNDDKGEAIRWSRQWLGLDDAAPAQLRLRQDEARRLSNQARARDEGEAKATRGRAFRLFTDAQESIAGTPVEKYLAGRNIDIRALGRQPGALRYAPRLYCRQLDQHFPAMVALITGPGEGGRNAFRAVHRTYLCQRGDAWVKVPELGGDAKLTYGRYAGGSIKLWRGKSAKPWSEAPADDVLAVSEGIEDGLTAAVSRPHLRVICAVSGSNMLGLDIPRQIRDVLVLAQNDGADHPATRTLYRAVARWQAQGHRVRVARPPPGVKDLNDLAREGGTV